MHHSVRKSDTKTLNMRSSIVLLVFVVVLGVFGECKGQLRKNFYRNSCPLAEQIVKSVTVSAVSGNPVLPAKLLRLHFHDCFVRGCDASLLINSTSGSTAEKDAPPNGFLAGFDVIENIKVQVEALCPGVVSCADIVALSTRDAVSAAFNRDLWKVLTGRRDGSISLASEVAANLPPPNFNFTSLKQNFANKGLTVHDLVVLSGAHTIGVGHCFLFRNRLYNFTGRGDTDPSLNATYAAFLRTQCPNNAADFASTAEMDPQSSVNFDTNYYKILKQNKGMFESDAALLTNRGARNIVDELVDTNKFLTEFAQSMERLAKVGVLTGNQGNIRTRCGVVNSVSSY